MKILKVKIVCILARCGLRKAEKIFFFVSGNAEVSFSSFAVKHSSQTKRSFVQFSYKKKVGWSLVALKKIYDPSFLLIKLFPFFLKKEQIAFFFFLFSIMIASMGDFIALRSFEIYCCDINRELKVFYWNLASKRAMNLVDK